MELLVLGVSHKTAPVELRERVALAEGGERDFLNGLLEADAIEEAVALSTCNRMEVYVVAADPVAAETAVLAQLTQRSGIRPTELIDSMYSLRNCDVARHLYRVTAGLDSMVVGETEIQGQVKRAYERALSAGATGKLTSRVFRAALETGKRVRTETGIGARQPSIPTVAVQLAIDSLDDLAGRAAVVIGAGETAELTAKALSDRGIGELAFLNRNRQRAIALAKRFGGLAAQIEELDAHLARADIVIAATASPTTVVGAEELEVVMAARAGRPLLLIDLAVPRDIDPECDLIAGVTLYDVDDLQAVVERNRSVREAEAQRAEAIVEEEIQRFAGWLGSLEVVPTIAALRAHGEEVVDKVLAENAGRWESLSERDRERLRTIGRAIVNRLLHEPTLRVKRADEEHQHARIQVLRELFGLEDGAPPLEDDHPQPHPRHAPAVRRRGHG